MDIFIALSNFFCLVKKEIINNIQLLNFFNNIKLRKDKHHSEILSFLHKGNTLISKVLN